MSAARRQELVERTIASAPPLTPEQRDRIARLLARAGAAVVTFAPPTPH